MAVDVSSVTNSILRGAEPTGMAMEDSGSTRASSARQMRLQRYWNYFRCMNYEGRKFDWDGREAVGPEERDLIAHSGVIPPGFYEAVAHDIPLKLRKPDVPYYLAKVVVKRFNSLLFSSRRHPKITSEDPRTEDWLRGFAEATRLWMRMLMARTYGGSMGSVAVGFKFTKGKPVVEVLDPRYTTPKFEDRATQELESLEVRYQFVEEVRNADGDWEDRWFWYRRIITKEIDRVWPRVPVEDDEPNWNTARFVEKQHGLGEHPFVWIQNQPVDDDVDGDPDCLGIFDTIEAIDQLQSQAHRGTKANCDPSLVISSDAEFNEVQKGTGNALQVEKGGSVDYLEMTGGGIDKSMSLADRFEEQALTVAQCMLDRNEGGPSRTEAEVEHNYSSMIDQADILREQYGEEGVKRLLEKVLRAARRLSTTSVDNTDPNTPRIVKRSIRIPRGKRTDPMTGKTEYYIRELGDGEMVELDWPEYFTPGLDTVNKAVDAAGKAKTAGIMDMSHIIRFLAQYFAVESPQEVLDKLKTEAPAMGGIGIPGGPPGSAFSNATEEQ